MRFAWYFVIACIASKVTLWLLGDSTEMSDLLFMCNAAIAATMTIKDHIDERLPQATFRLPDDDRP